MGGAVTANMDSPPAAGSAQGADTNATCSDERSCGSAALCLTAGAIGEEVSIQHACMHIHVSSRSTVVTSPKGTLSATCLKSPGIQYNASVAVAGEGGLQVSGMHVSAMMAQATTRDGGVHVHAAVLEDDCGYVVAWNPG